jgi:uncharacterized protein involved in response to NO
MIVIAGALWMLAFTLFLILHGPALLRRPGPQS